jgi:hypothetical protein
MTDMKIFIGKNRLNISLVVFLVIFSLIHYLKPGIVYNENGEFRNFGIGYRHKTVIPIWLVAIITAIFSYLFVMSYLVYI